MKPTHAAAVIAGLVLLVGLILGVTPVSAGTVHCGSAFGGVDAQAVGVEDAVASYGQALGEPAPQTSYADQCSSAVSSRRAVTWPLLGVSAVGLLFVGLVGAGRREAATA